MKSTSKKNDISVPAIDKMCLILDLITESNYPLTSTEIATKLKLPKSSTHNILQSLLSKHLVFKDRDNRFHLGSYLLYWAGKYEKQHSIIDVFHELINSYPVLLKNTVTLSKLDSKQVVFLACHESPAPLGFTFRSGVRVPAPFAATGKAMLAAYDDQTVIQIFDNEMPEPFTTRSVDTVTKLMAELRQVRQTGISLDDGQLREGMYCLGTCILDGDGQPIAGMAVSFVKEEYQKQRDVVSQALLALAKDISLRLGLK
ncbi:IclR family transcriptional regulator [Psychrobacter lutiphocae]|uniref:IclR family transcriptional regulator n=1 Tax=Psychrobacter lutiphocae TaxID=540500 RepID=UPI0003778EA1|nr:IclR family transcriptional regulator [Psychrobacter lutiphocae]